MLDISEIDMVRITCELGSINRAAEVLCMSQPTLSKKIARLEQKLSLQLFYRDSSGMKPTPVAQSLLRDSQDLKHQLDAIARRLELMSNAIGGTVNVGVGAIVEQDILPGVLLDFAEQNSSFAIAATTMSSEDLLDALNTSQIDIAIGSFALDEVPADVVVPFVKSDSLVVVTRPNHPLTTQSSTDLATIADYDIVAPKVPENVASQFAAQLAGKQMIPKIINNNYALAKTITANTDFICLGPESLFHNELRAQELIKLELVQPIMWRCKCLVKPETLALPIVKQVVDLFGNYMEAPSY